MIFPIESTINMQNFIVINLFGKFSSSHVYSSLHQAQNSGSYITNVPYNTPVATRGSPRSYILKMGTFPRITNLYNTVIVTVFRTITCISRLYFFFGLYCSETSTIHIQNSKQKPNTNKYPNPPSKTKPSKTTKYYNRILNLSSHLASP